MMARIDSLFEGAKELLQTGSVAGREFSHQLLEKIAGVYRDRLLGASFGIKELGTSI
jgi:predicted ATPase